jgi:hypothetical protein
MDVSDASYYIQENNENKGSRMGHTKKIFKKTVHDDESPIELEGLVGQTNRLIPGVVPESARITVGNLYTRTRGKVVSGRRRQEKAPLDPYIVVKL